MIGRSLIQRLLTLRTRITAGVPLSVIAVRENKAGQTRDSNRQEESYTIDREPVLQFNCKQVSLMTFRLRSIEEMDTAVPRQWQNLVTMEFRFS